MGKGSSTKNISNHVVIGNDDLLIEIMSFGDVRTLMQIKAVCRRWRHWATKTIDHKSRGRRRSFRTKTELVLTFTLYRKFGDNEFYMEYIAKTYGYPIGQWDVSLVTDFSFLFSEQANFNEDISNWNTSQAITMSGMFYRARAFNRDISEWNTSKVINMSWMFEGASSFNQDLSEWDTSNVKEMQHMFYGASSFNQDLSRWNVSNARQFAFMFAKAVQFSQNLSSWDMCRCVGSNDLIKYMFQDATSMKENWKPKQIE
mmetsp:Transcript_22039/g.32562  ORF Transcript_22039/g.32562 Transcript_22039/m.32562 type:complete len:258 (+) Transcript_22039:69-842(+)